MPNLDRFSVGIADRQEQPVAFMEHCANIRCHNLIFAGDEVWEEDGRYYCDSDCYAQAGDARLVIAGEEE